MSQVIESFLFYTGSFFINAVCKSKGFDFYELRGNSFFGLTRWERAFEEGGTLFDSFLWKDLQKVEMTQKAFDTLELSLFLVEDGKERLLRLQSKAGDLGFHYFVDELDRNKEETTTFVNKAFPWQDSFVERVCSYPLGSGDATKGVEGRFATIFWWLLVWPVWLFLWLFRYKAETGPKGIRIKRFSASKLYLWNEVRIQSIDNPSNDVLGTRKIVLTLETPEKTEVIALDNGRDGVALLKELKKREIQGSDLLPFFP